MGFYLCFDIGGTAIKYGILDGEKESFLTDGTVPTEAGEGGPAIVNKVTALGEEMLARHRAEGICISTAGMVDWKAGRILYSAPQIPEYAGTEWKDRMEKHFRLPCEVENDVNCAGLAEVHAGAAKGYSAAVCLTIGTGIGGAILLDGKVFHGATGSACEVGYMNMPGGMFERLGAASALVAAVAARRGIPAGQIDGKSIFEQAKAGARDCLEAIEDMTDVLSMGIANICYVLNPQIVVLGGGIMAQEEMLLPMIRAGLKRHMLPFLEEQILVRAAQNRNRAGMLGAWFHFKNLRLP